MDLLGDFLTRIRNAVHAGHEKVDLPASNMRSGIAEVLKREGYIRNYKVAKDGRQGMMRVYLKYNEKGSSVLSCIERISSPGRRVYVACSDIPQVRSGFGISILSTNQGVMSNKEAVSRNIGGELLCKVW